MQLLAGDQRDIHVDERSASPRNARETGVWPARAERSAKRSNARMFLELASGLIGTAQQAGAAILKHVPASTLVERKSDESPVTQADRDAEALILPRLAELAPDIPVIAEEAVSANGLPEPSVMQAGRFFLVDPLDGTKEFIKGGTDFTVNIALIENGVPTFGLVFAPALKHLYLTLSADQGVEAWIDPNGPDATLADFEPRELKVRTAPEDGLTVVASKSHMTAETEAFLETLNVADFKQAGSSLKFGLVARGVADIYPRFGPTMEWDTAAGHAVLLAAGGSVCTQDGAPLRYGKLETGLLNPFFIARGRSLG